jgi:hypothetical protein
MRYTNQKIEYIVSLYNQGLNSTDIASPHFLKQIIKFLTKEGIYFTYRKNVNTYIITMCRTESVKKIYDLMYSDSSVSLDRKRELFGSLLKKLNSKHLPNSVKAKESTTDYVAC